MALNAVLDHIDADQPNALERLFALLRIESISTDPAYAGACRAAADWLVDELEAIGFEASRRDTPGHPMVVAQGGDGGPHFLFYGHYDVQPADPLELWARPPFDPAIADGPRGPAIFGRGASDDKGQLMTFLEAVRAWKAVNGRLPGRLTILLEGEEESGSPSLVPFLKANAAELARPYGARLRYRHARSGDAGDLDDAARPRRGRDHHPCGGSGPAFRRLWRRGDQSDPGAVADHRRAARRAMAGSRCRASTTASASCRRRSRRSGRRSTTTRRGS